jgi:hypothetical protein
MSYAVRKDGQGWRAVDRKSDCTSDETFSDIQPVLVPTIQEIIAALENGVQFYIDSKAQAKGFDSANSCISYMNSSIAAWKAEAIAMNAWRDTVWQFCYTNQASASPVVTESALIAALPSAPW